MNICVCVLISGNYFILWKLRVCVASGTSPSFFMPAFLRSKCRGGIWKPFSYFSENFHFKIMEVLCTLWHSIIYFDIQNPQLLQTFFKISEILIIYLIHSHFLLHLTDINTLGVKEEYLRCLLAELNSSPVLPESDIYDIPYFFTVLVTDDLRVNRILISTLDSVHIWHEQFLSPIPLCQLT